jgi:hypothetical protein
MIQLKVAQNVTIFGATSSFQKIPNLQRMPNLVTLAVSLFKSTMLVNDFAR